MYTREAPNPRRRGQYECVAKRQGDLHCAIVQWWWCWAGRWVDGGWWERVEVGGGGGRCGEVGAGGGGWWKVRGGGSK